MKVLILAGYETTSSMVFPYKSILHGINMTDYIYISQSHGGLLTKMMHCYVI